MNIWGGLPRWLVLLGTLILGLVCIVVPHVIGLQRDFGIIPDIGIAFLTSSILAFTIDRWLRAELRTDAFKAALGHVLLPEFRAEVSRIIGYSLLCEEHSQLVEIEMASPNVVKVTTSIQRVIRNRSAYAQPIKNKLDIDEWGYAEGKSQIIECELKLEGQTIKAGEPTLEEYSVHAMTEERQLEPDHIAEIHSKWIEYKSINDQLFYHFAIPTINPEIEVAPAPEVNCEIGFGTPDQNKREYHYVNKRKLIGTYFPHQHMSVRWWPKRTSH